MRYSNWDLVLRAHSSNDGPLQEFRTDCYSVSNGFTSVPTLLCFVPTLPVGTPFCILFRSWTDIEWTWTSQNPHEVAAIEFSVTVDGSHAFSCTLTADERPSLVIGELPSGDPKLDRRVLRFPSFDQMFQNESVLRIADNKGRIKVLLSEGFRYLQPGMGRPLFRSTREIVAFKWFYAPLKSLQFNSIAYPNALTSNVVDISQPGISQYHPLAKIPSSTKGNGADPTLSSDYVSPATMMGSRPMANAAHYWPQAQQSTMFSGSGSQPHGINNVSTLPPVLNDPFKTNNNGGLGMPHGTTSVSIDHKPGPPLLNQHDTANELSGPFVQMQMGLPGDDDVFVSAMEPSTASAGGNQMIETRPTGRLYASKSHSGDSKTLSAASSQPKTGDSSSKRAGSTPRKNATPRKPQPLSIPVRKRTTKSRKTVDMDADYQAESASPPPRTRKPRAKRASTSKKS